MSPIAARTLRRSTSAVIVQTPRSASPRPRWRPAPLPDTASGSQSPEAGGKTRSRQRRRPGRLDRPGPGLDEAAPAGGSGVLDRLLAAGGGGMRRQPPPVQVRANRNKGFNQPSPEFRKWPAGDPAAVKANDEIAAHQPCATAMPFSASSFLARSFLARWVRPIPRSTLGALVNWTLS